MENTQPERVHKVRVLSDLIAIILLVGIFISIKYAGKPFHRGFFCDDYSINMPFKSSTVTNAHLILISSVMPILFLIFTEFLRFAFIKRDNMVPSSNQSNKKNKASEFKSNSSLSTNKTNYELILFNRRVKINEFLFNLYVNVGWFFFGLAATADITDFAKIVIGRLRPNFLSVCKPASDPYELCYNRTKTYIEPQVDFQCLNLKGLDESRLSFPSGHSSMSFYSMLFLVFFINRAWNFKSLGLLLRFLQFALFSLAVYTGLSRIVDNKHHPTDVLSGALLGALISIAVSHCLNKFLKRINYKTRYYTDESRSSSNEDLLNSEDVESDYNNDGLPMSNTKKQLSRYDKNFSVKQQNEYVRHQSTNYNMNNNDSIIL